MAMNPWQLWAPCSVRRLIKTSSARAREAGSDPSREATKRSSNFFSRSFPSLMFPRPKSQGCFLFSSLGCLFFLDWGYFEKKMIEAVDIALQPGKLWDSAKSALGDTSSDLSSNSRDRC